MMYRPPQWNDKGESKINLNTRGIGNRYFKQLPSLCHNGLSPDYSLLIAFWLSTPGLNLQCTDCILLSSGKHCVIEMHECEISLPQSSPPITPAVLAWLCEKWWQCRSTPTSGENGTPGELQFKLANKFLFRATRAAGQWKPWVDEWGELLMRHLHRLHLPFDLMSAADSGNAI